MDREPEPSMPGRDRGAADGLDRQMIVLVHGLASSSILMKPLAWRLRRYGYRTRTWGYPSILHDIERHGQRLADFLRRLDDDPQVRQLHLVTHSMGCIVARYALQQFRPKKTDRMVMLAPPNRGSHVASRLSPYLGKICKPLDQLRDHEDSWVQGLAGVRALKVGIVAAARDFVVPLASTQVEWQDDHTVLPGLHTALLFRTDTARQVHRFLRDGRFTSDEQGKKEQDKSEAPA